MIASLCFRKDKFLYFLNIDFELSKIYFIFEIDLTVGNF